MVKLPGWRRKLLCLHPGSFVRAHLPLVTRIVDRLYSRLSIRERRGRTDEGWEGRNAMQDTAGSKLNELVQQARDVDGIDAVLVIDRDGMTLASSAGEGIDTESLSATSASYFLIADSLGAELAHLGEATQTTIEFAGGVVILTPLDEDLALLLLAHTGTNLGRLRLLARRSRGDLLGAAKEYVMLPGSAAHYDDTSGI